MKVVELVSSWWRVDRVRNSPREGRLLRLSPPSVLRIAGRRYRLISRRATSAGGKPCVVYHCRSPAGGCELRVIPGARARHPRVEWVVSGRVSFLEEDEVEVELDSLAGRSGWTTEEI